MKNRYVAILLVQFLVILCLLLYAFIQKSEADLQKLLARENEKIATKNGQAAIENFKLAKRETARADSLQRVVDKLGSSKGK